MSLEGTVDGDVATVLYVTPETTGEVAGAFERRDARVEVVAETDPERALTRLEADTFDCIVSGHDPPDVDGLKLLDSVRARAPNLPFVLFPANGSEAVASRAISAGVTDYVHRDTDPNPYETLAERVGAIVSDRQSDPDTSDRFERFLETFPGVAFAIDDTGRYVELLAGGEDMLLYDDPAELLGRRIHDVLPEATADRFLETIRQVLETGEQQRIEYRLDVQEGQRWFEARVGPLETGLDADRRTVLWVARDITEAKRREREYEQIFDGVIEGILVKDPYTLEIIDANEAYLDMFGYDDIETVQSVGVEGLSVTEEGFTVERSRRLNRRVAETGESELVEWRVETADGERRWMEIKIAPAIIGGREVNISIHRDVTDRRRREQRLGVLNRVLRHNVRNQVDVVKAHAESGADDDDRRHADRIIEAADALLDLSNRARTIDRVLSDEFQADRIDLADRVAEVLNDIDGPGMGVDVVVNLPSDPVLTTDRRALTAILTSALENAAAYADSLVRVTAERRADGWTVVIDDDGPGIPPAELDALSDGTETDLQHGRGLGLWQLKWAVEKVDGRISFETDGGTTVRIALPDRDRSGHE